MARRGVGHPLRPQKGERALLHDDHVRPAVGGVNHRVAAIRAEAPRPHDGDSHVVGTDLRHLHARQLSRGFRHSRYRALYRAVDRPHDRARHARQRRLCRDVDGMRCVETHAGRLALRRELPGWRRPVERHDPRHGLRGIAAADDHRRPFHLVDVGKRHVPESVRQDLVHEAARRVVQLELPLAALLARPEKALPVGQPPRHGGIDVDPRGIVLGNERRRLAGGRVHREELTLVLETVHHVDAAAVRPSARRRAGRTGTSPDPT